MKERIEYWPLTKIKPYPKNPRINGDAVVLVANSIKEFGFRSPIVADKAGVIVAGHTRLNAAKKLGLKEAPVIVANDLSDEQVKALRLADNKTAEAADWDLDLLDQEISDIADIDVFPTQVGVIPARLEQHLVNRGIPHVCGGNPFFMLLLFFVLCILPHMRG